MKVGFVFTNYNNSGFTRNAIKSIYSFKEFNSARVVVVDNKSLESDVDSLRAIWVDYPEIEVIFNDKNLGYFSGLNVGIKFLREKFKDIDHIVIGNNDLVFSENFMQKIKDSEDLFKEYAVISPDLITIDGIHQNPHVISRISLLREFVWDVYYLNYCFVKPINYLASITKMYTARTDAEEYKIARPVSQGYGACYILGPIFFQKFENLWSPTFLMGEEFFLTIQLEKEKLFVFYDPRFVVYHHDHATMAKLPNKQLWKYAKEAHQVYRRFVRPFWIFGLKRNMKLPE